MTLNLAKDLKTSSFWGPGARLAELMAKHGNREDIESYTEALLEEVDA